MPILFDDRPLADYHQFYLADAADHIVVGHIHPSGEIAIVGLSDYFPHVPRAVVQAGYLGVMIVPPVWTPGGRESGWQGLLRGALMAG